MYCTSSSCFKKVLLCNPWTPNSGGLDSSECHLLNDPKQGSTSCRIYVYMCVCARASLFKCSLFPFPNFVFQVISSVAPAADHRLKWLCFALPVLRALYQSLSSSIPNRSNSPYLYNIYTISNTFSDPILSFPEKKSAPSDMDGQKAEKLFGHFTQPQQWAVTAVAGHSRGSQGSQGSQGTWQPRGLNDVNGFLNGSGLE